MVPVRVYLVPLGSEQGGDRGDAPERSPRGSIDLHIGVGLQEFYLALVGGEPVFHVLRHSAHVQGTLAMGENLLSTVVTGHNDKTVVSVKDVINIFSGTD